MSFLVWIWGALLLALLWLLISRGYSGGILLLAYFIGLSIIHVPGALIYLGSAPGLFEEPETHLGFKATLIGMAALLAGALAALRTQFGRAPPPNGPSFAFSNLGYVMVALGAVMYFIVMPVVSFISSITALLSAVGSLLPFGFWCFFYGAMESHDNRKMVLGIALLPLLPLSTMITGGFIGYGVYWVIAVLALVYVKSSQKRIWVLLAPLIVLLGLSFAVAYFGGRNELREAVWNERADLGARIERVVAMVSSFELLNLDNPDHVKSLNDRLNQNVLVGTAIYRHEAGDSELALGGTVPWWALIPRVIWPDKPAVGGGGSVVSEFTGMTFGEDTSVGAGQPLEFYINFGWAGIVGGFLLLGYVLARLDMALDLAFRQGDLNRLLNTGLPGLALLQPGGNLLEILVAVVGAMVAARAVAAGLERFHILQSMSPSRDLLNDPAPGRVRR
ncbi:MAG: hypothetical protein NT123_05575 [Proteobacteria bacterium]|nr:hypothetical protein [Pseudomonadota bacterium]